MDKKTLGKLLQKGLNIDGYTVTGGEGAVLLKKETENVTTQLIFSYRKYPDEYILAPYVTGWITIKEVEDILQKYYRRQKLKYPVVTLHVTSERNIEIQDHVIRNSYDTTQIFPILTNLINDKIIPFFSDYDNIESIGAKLNSLELSEISSFIFRPPIPKVIVIKKLVNSEDWESFSKWAIESYKEMANGPHSMQHAPIYSFLPDLYEELKNMDLS